MTVELIDRTLTATELLRVPKEPCLMGVLNVTPDSFYDGGKYLDPTAAVRRAEEMVEEGAGIIDIGGESTRPGADQVDEKEEIRRVIPVIEAVRSALPDQMISIDTYKAEVFRQAFLAGANLLNDVTALQGDRHMARCVSQAKVPVILMHMKGTPRVMQVSPSYPQGIISELLLFFKQRIHDALSWDISLEQIWLDPGIGFGKSLTHNLEILKNLDSFLTFKLPLVIGTSRKSFMGQILGGIPPSERLSATVSSCLWAVSKGASILRVHDVKEVKKSLEVWNTISESQQFAQREKNG